MQIINLVDCKKYYKGLSHQKGAVEYLGGLLLKTPAKNRLHLYDPYDWIELSDKELNWLQDQISNPTLQRFALLWRAEKVMSFDDQIEYFSQRDNKILPYTSCNSSAHAMFVDYVLKTKFGKQGLGTDDEYVSRVYSGKYGRYGRNNSVSWDIQINVVRSFGIKARYNNRGKAALIKELTTNNMVAPANFKHKGSLSSPHGGHVVLIAGWDRKKGFLIYDPYGTRMPSYKDTKNGVYWMSNKEFDRRWQGLFTQYLGKV